MSCVLSVPTIPGGARLNPHQEPNHPDASRPALCPTLPRAIRALAGLALLVASERADAETINVYPSVSSTPINDAIKSSNKGDTIIFNKGKDDYGLEQYGFYTFLEDRNYVFNDGVIINGFTNEGGLIYRVIGSNVNITGNGTVRMEHTGMAGIFGDTGYPAITNVNVSGIISNASSIHYEWTNILHLTERDEKIPDIKFSNMTLIGGSTGFNFASVIYPGNPENIVNAKTPYISIENTTADTLATKLVSIPTRDDLTTPTLLDTQYYLKNNVLINTVGITTPTLYQYFNTPENLAQKDVTNPYINSAKNDFVTTDMKFMPGTYIPQHDSPLNLGDGEYIGAKVPEGTSRVSGVSFNISPLNDFHTQLRATDLWIEFSGDNMFLNTGSGTHPWKLDMKYHVEYLIDDHNPATPDQVLASTDNHIILSFNEPVDKISPPDFFAPECLIDAGTWDIYARITSYASDGLFDILGSDRDKYLDYMQFAPYESERITVTALPEPATLSLIALGGSLLALRRRPCIKGK